MSYLGNTPTQQNFVAGADQFSGTGSQTAFTLSRVVNTVFDIFVTVSNVPQDPFTAYTISGNTLTFDSAPPSGTNNIDVVYRATNVQTFVPSPLSVSTPQIVDNSITTAKIAAGAVIPADLSTGAPAWTDAGLFQFNSGYGSVATAYGCRAWVNFNGTGTVAIRASGNVSSITDNNTGDYTVNFTTAMPDANYAVVPFAGTIGSTNVFVPTLSSAASPQIAASVRIVTRSGASAATDLDMIQVAIFR